MEAEIIIKESLERRPSAQIVPIRAEEGFIGRSNSLRTRREYSRIVGEFIDYAGRDFASISHESVLAWHTQKSATIQMKLSVIRSFFDYLVLGGICRRNPANSKLVPPPRRAEQSQARALSTIEVRRMLASPDRNTVTGARDFAILLTLFRLALRRSELCKLKLSDRGQNMGISTFRIKGKGGKERILPVPKDVETAIAAYLKLDWERRRLLHVDGDDDYIFQPTSNYRSGNFNKALDESMIWRIVDKWSDYAGVGPMAPHGCRASAITVALDQGCTYAEIQDMTGHASADTVRLYDRKKNSLKRSAINKIDYNKD